MPRKKTTEQFIEESKQKYGEKFDYSVKKLQRIWRSRHIITV